MKKIKDYFITIGLEIHIALKTKEKLFSSTPNDFAHEEFELFDAGVPGILPVLSQEPVEMAIAFGLAVDSKIQKRSIFERKHYFYPDLPLGYQITQQHHPILLQGHVEIKDEEGYEKTVQIEHAHLECDAAKSIHANQYTQIDLARCASPLLEIVSTPCLHSSHEAKEYARKIHALTTFMGICDGKIEEGSFRVDASISLSKTDKLGTRVEIKNISSFGFLQAALDYEIQRQYEVLEQGGKLKMETRLFDENGLCTKSMRSKETVDEYRYMPDPDIPELLFTDDLIEKVKNQFDIDYLKYQGKIESLFSSHGLKYEEKLFGEYWKTQTQDLWKFFLQNIDKVDERKLRLLAFWIKDIYWEQKSQKILTLEDFEILYKSGLQAPEIKKAMSLWFKNDQPLKDCLPQMMLKDDLKIIVQNILLQYPEQIEKYLKGEKKIVQFLIGKVMSQTKGSAGAKDVSDMVQLQLNNRK